jgi:small-conductance mechanosensitive channel
MNFPPASRTAVRKTLIAIVAVTLLLSPGFVGALSTVATAETPPATLSPAMTVIDTVTQTTASEELQRAAQTRLEHAGRWRDLAQRVTVLEADLDGLAVGTNAEPELIELITLARQLETFHSDAATVVDDLGSIVRQIEHDGDTLESDARKWQERLLFLEKKLVPVPVLERARSIAAELQRTSARIREYRDNVLLALNRALVLQTRIDDARALVAAQYERVNSQRMKLEQVPLWQLPATPAQFKLVAAELRAEWRLLRTYSAREGAGLAGLFFGVLALTGWLFIRGSPQDGGAAQRGYGRPAAASLLIALMSLWWLAPAPPLLFYEALLVLVPIPAAMVAQRAFAAPIPLTLYGLAMATALVPVRNTVEASTIADRALLLLQSICYIVPITVDLYKGRLLRVLPRLSPGVVRTAALLVIAAATLGALHAIFGYSGLAPSLRAAIGRILGFGLVFGTTALAVYGAVHALLATPLLGWLRSARSADPALLRAVRVVLTAITVAGVAIVTLGSFGLLPTLHSAIESLIGGTLEVGTVSIAGKAVATALAAAVATFVLTRLTGFILDREIVPRLQLRPGAGFAIVTFARWTIVIVGATLTLAALGIDMAKLTLLASAVGVGIGFGLQTVVNNFVSGVILIVERPVSVGDLIEIGPLLGEVKRIGIRSSIVRTMEGAEVIVPNAELVSKEVVNWTRSDRQRRYDIDVGVAYGSEPEQVMRMLLEAAKEVPEVTTDPAPLALFKGYGDSSLDFRLLAWVQTVDVGLAAQNALRVAILRKLDQAGIAMPFPQRDVHIYPADEGARPARS